MSLLVPSSAAPVPSKSQPVQFDMQTSDPLRRLGTSNQLKGAQVKFQGWSKVRVGLEGCD